MSFLKRHLQALVYVVTVVLPIIFRTGTRPVIFSKYSGIGDIICTIPAALELKRRHTQAEFIYDCYTGYACLPRLGGVTNHVTSLEPIGLVGFWYGFLLSGFYQFSSDDDHLDRTPTDVYIKDFGRPFGLVLDDAHPRLHNEDSVVQRVKLMLEKKGLRQGPFVVIQTGPTWPVREWPRESWAMLVEELARRGFTQVIQLGTSGHLALASSAFEAIPGVVSLVDQLTLEESVALIELGDLFIGIDSGLLHVSVAVGTLSVGLWGATSPQFRFSAANRRFFVTSKVECQGCHHRVPRLHWITGCPFDIRCMKEISVAEVLEQCLSALATDQRSL